MVVLFVAASLLYSLFTAPGRRVAGRGKGGRYRFRRLFERFAGYSLALIAIFVVVASVPVVAQRFGGDAGQFGGPFAVIVGFGSAFWSFIKTGQKAAGRVPIGFLAPVGAFVLVYGLWLSAYAIAFAIHLRIMWQDHLIYWGVPAGIFALTVIVGGFANINYVSLHRYYRDRLMETFLPDPENAYANKTAAATMANPFRLSEVTTATKPLKSGKTRGPYHIINTNVILVDSKRRRWRIRGGDNFILSPLCCGSNATGWRTTSRFMKNGMTLATAMAISGAAANPNTGVGGGGLTRDRAISVLMSILNFRLGYWAHNPRKPPIWPFRRPNYLRPGVYEFFGTTTFGGMHEGRPFVQLSDGGHFENLAVYELIRRKLRLIICCDGGNDPEFKFADLQNALRRVEEDFGARITFPNNQKPAELVPTLNAGYPMDSKQSARGYIVGDIAYADDTYGKLILMKTTMVPGLATTVKGYKGANPDFPDQSTADQFFDENQFEAYRELGYHIGQSMADQLDLPAFIHTIEAAAGDPVPNPW